MNIRKSDIGANVIYRQLQLEHIIYTKIYLNKVYNGETVNIADYARIYSLSLITFVKQADSAELMK